MKQLFIIILAAVLVVGCSSVPDMNEMANDPDKMWEEGKKISERGEKLIVKGEKNLEEARSTLREGEGLIQSGTENILKARQDYQTAVTQFGGSSSPKEVEFEADKLAAIGERWEDAIDDVKKGNSMVAKSKTMQDKAQAQIREGRELVETGSTFIRNSQRLRLNVPLLDAPKTES